MAVGEKLRETTTEWEIAYMSDHPACLPVLAEWMYCQWYAHIDLSLDDAYRTLETRLRRDDIPMTLVAIDGDNTPHGMASLGYLKLADGRKTPGLTGLYVRPSSRGRGLGKSLCRRIVVEAQRIRLERLFLRTPDQQRFYESLGWERDVATPVEHANALALMHLALEKKPRRRRLERRSCVGAELEQLAIRTELE